MTETSSRKPRSARGWSLRLKKVAGAGVLGMSCAFNVAPAQAEEAAQPRSALAQVHSFDIPAQKLAIALINFGQQSGLQVSVDPDLLDGLHSTAVSGQLSSEAALAQLLLGTGITWDYEYGALMFRLLQADNGALELHNTLVLGDTEENSFMGTTVIDRKAIQAFPGANGDITTLLQMHPNVQFSTEQKSSNTPGEIDPADISINGAKFYQNNFMIDGISINNDLDPGAHGYNETRQFDSAPSRSHGIALDADLLEEVRVYDSNVPVEFGGFNGGVVDAITRRPSQDLHGKVSYAMSRSEWTRYHITRENKETFETSSNEKNQPEFKKTTLRGTLEGHFNEDFGALFNFSQKRSYLPLRAYKNGYNSPNNDNEEEQTRALDNFLLKTYWTVNDRLTLDTSIVYAPQENTYFREDYKDSHYTNINGGWQGSFKATYEGDSATWTQQLAVTNLNTSRDSDRDDNIMWYWSDDKDWGNPDGNNPRSIEGAYGSLYQTQRGVDYKLKADWQTIPFAGGVHSITTGLELGYQRATWEREDDALSVITFKTDTGTSCAGGDPWCSVSPMPSGDTRQWGRVYMNYGAGKVDLDQKKYALFVQDVMGYGNLTLRPGLRFEGDDYMEKKSLAPRFSGDYDFFGDRSTVLVFGANRYYGRNLFKYRLADGRQAFTSRYTRASQDGEWVLASQNKNLSKFSTMDIPYDDEWMVGLNQRWFDTDFQLKYVNRKGHDQIYRTRPYYYLGADEIPEGYSKDYYAYLNAGTSESENVSLTVTPMQPLRFMGTSTSLQLALDWSRTKDAYGATYEAGVESDELAGADVVLDGKRIPYHELPASDYNRPWTARLMTITNIPQWNLTVSNFFRYRGAYDQVVGVDPDVEVAGEVLETYETVATPAAPTWDLRLAWDIPTGKDQAFFVNVDVTNVTDKVNKIASRESVSLISYEVGRQYWLEVGYRF
ncbi:outer membrane receptor protein involved in Fe transport [Pseudomonas sp. RV120224-01b]|nr:outer membrane receptor protein involved in Fe transport [Pseudomonas sp. RV120224-01c]PYG80672.1 outer membrane receptor protein involved in Fe transport [Pseudomonas sp. RV120224-01b]